MECLENMETIETTANFKQIQRTNVHENVNEKSSSSDEMGFKNLVFMRVSNKFV